MKQLSALYPPNAKTFSLNVIGGVAERRMAASNKTMRPRGEKRLRSPEEANEETSAARQFRIVPTHAPVTFAPRKEPNNTPDALPSTLTENQCPSEFTYSNMRSNGSIVPGRTDSSEVAIIEFLRRRGRLHQERYRIKKRRHLQALEHNIQALHEAIWQLYVQKKITSLYVSSCTTAWSVTAEFFRLFRFGVQVPADLEHGANDSKTCCPFETRIQRAFLQSTMISDVSDGTVSGVEAIMTNWTRVSIYNPGLRIELTRMDEGPGGCLVASVKQTLTITECMPRATFPHLIGASPEYSKLGARLLGQEMVTFGSVCFEWDYASKRIARFVFKADMVTPMLRLLGSLENVSRVFENASLTPEGGLVENCDS